MKHAVRILKVSVPRSATAIAMRARRQSAGPHRHKLAARGNPRTEARRAWRGDVS
jgi:hypothetical protein